MSEGLYRKSSPRMSVFLIYIIMEQETWKDIPKFKWYLVSNLWNVKSVWWRWWETKWIIMKPSIWHKWYKYVTLFIWEKRHRRSIHRLVASAFLWLDIDNRLICACHKDDNPWNNKATNLFLWTNQDNMDDKMRKWRWRLKWSAINKPIIQMDLRWNYIREWETGSSIYKNLWFFPSNIVSCCKWRQKSSKWFTWKYKSKF